MDLQIPNDVIYCRQQVELLFCSQNSFMQAEGRVNLEIFASNSLFEGSKYEFVSRFNGVRVIRYPTIFISDLFRNTIKSVHLICISSLNVGRQYLARLDLGITAEPEKRLDLAFNVQAKANM